MKQDVKKYFESYGLNFIKRIANIKDDVELCKELEISHKEFIKNGFEPFVKNIVKYCNERIINLNYVFGVNLSKKEVMIYGTKN